MPSLYLVVEHFRNGDALPVYRRLHERGRMMPEGVSYVLSWVDEHFTRCYQVMQASDRRLLDEWMARWSDLVDFEVHCVMTSADAAERIAPKL